MTTHTHLCTVRSVCVAETTQQLQSTNQAKTCWQCKSPIERRASSASVHVNCRRQKPLALIITQRRWAPTQRGMARGGGDTKVKAKEILDTMCACVCACLRSRIPLICESISSGASCTEWHENLAITAHIIGRKGVGVTDLQTFRLSAWQAQKHCWLISNLTKCHRPSHGNT